MADVDAQLIGKPPQHAATFKGATGPQVDGVVARLRPAREAGPKNLLWARHRAGDSNAALAAANASQADTSRDRGHRCLQRMI